MIAGFFLNAPCKLRAYNIADNMHIRVFLVYIEISVLSFFFKKEYIILLLHFRVGV